MDLPFGLPRRIPSPNKSFLPRCSTSRSNSQTLTESSHSHTPMAMTISNTRHDDAPPPLPPPRFNDDLANGVDLAWTWGNRHDKESSRKLAPIKPGSSLFGGYMHSRSSTKCGDGEDFDGMNLDDVVDRRGSTVSTIRSPSQPEIEVGRHTLNGVRRPPSPAASLANQRLQGEMPLAQENFSRSSHAYDKHVLSKIGKSNSPPRHLRSESGDGSALLAQKLSLETNHSGGMRLSVTDIPSSATDSMSRWVTSPISAGVSPGSRQGWRDYNMDYRSPSVDSPAAGSALDSELYAHLREGARPSTSSSLPSIDDSISLASRSMRGSYDQNFFHEHEIELPEEPGVFRRLQLSDTTSQQPLETQPPFSTGMKRRALSPPSAVARDDKLVAHAPELSQRSNNATVGTRSPTMRYQLKHGSFSSTSSSIRHNSYASSVGLSVAGSSMTSVSSNDRFSPGDLSPPENQASPFTPATSQNSPAAGLGSFRKVVSISQEDRSSLPAQNTSVPISMSETLPASTNRIVGLFICECCPKKPKKFDTLDKKRAHEMEKQYSCNFCHNRFKNKNEAERHQNSLHLRRHSWACAAISGCQAAFHLSTSNSSQHPTGPSSDACGYCGEEFPNNPEPDWDLRIAHLTNVHKFGECNQAKKFYRADHFRQHLKHSHAGTSGKWTNMLENACMKDELPFEMSSGSPTGSSESGRGPSSLPPPGDPPMGGETIRETLDES